MIYQNARVPGKRFMTGFAAGVRQALFSGYWGVYWKCLIAKGRLTGNCFVWMAPMYAPARLLRVL